jgi:hypothetical protein
MATDMNMKKLENCKNTLSLEAMILINQPRVASDNSQIRLASLVQEASIRREMPTSWPLCSPDFIPCDFYLWGTVKEQNTYHRPPMPRSIMNCTAHSQRRRVTVVADIPVTGISPWHVQQWSTYRTSLEKFTNVHAVLKAFHICICKRFENELIY